jgi:mannosyl-3-phosphoglycerate phosphatase
MEQLVVFTDLDGTLLDPVTYSFDAAREALALLPRRHIPLVLVSSKTRAEMEPIRSRLTNQAPFIVENGGGLFVPHGYFDFPLEGATQCAPYQVIEWGGPYPVLRQALAEIRQAVGDGVRGFGDMTVEEVARRTGLAAAEAALAMQREYDEPFVIEGSARPLEEIRRLAEPRGLRCTSGGRLHHLLGQSDKGRACRYLTECYRRRFNQADRPLLTVALGDSLNDLPMLAEADLPILVQKPDGSYDPGVTLPHLIRASDVGPGGWNAALLRLLAGR